MKLDAFSNALVVILDPSYACSDSQMYYPPKYSVPMRFLCIHHYRCHAFSRFLTLQKSSFLYKYNTKHVSE